MTVGYVVAVAAMVGAVAGLNLVLTVGVIRRLRQHTTRLAMLSDALLSGGPEVGDEVADFSSYTVDGTRVSAADLRGDWVVAFVSPGCEPCERLLPDLVAWLRDAGDAEPALVVVTGEPAETAGMETSLRGLAPAVREDSAGGPVQAAFGVRAFPTVVTVAGGVVTSVGSQLPERMAAASTAALR